MTHPADTYSSDEGPVCPYCGAENASAGNDYWAEKAGSGAMVYEAPRDPAEALKVRGVGRIGDEARSILVALTERPTDDEMCALHNYLRTWPCVSIGAEVEGEYYRQINDEGYDFDHDDAHSEGQLACAAVAYAMPEWLNEWMDKNDIKIWPFEGMPNFKNRRRDLVRAAALLIAEIARLDRAAYGDDTAPTEG